MTLIRGLVFTAWLANAQNILDILNEIEPTDYPQFKVDYDQPAATRFNEVYDHFKEPLLEMENTIYATMNAEYKQFFKDNELTLKEN